MINIPKFKTCTRPYIIFNPWLKLHTSPIGIFCILALKLHTSPNWNILSSVTVVLSQNLHQLSKESFFMPNICTNFKECPILWTCWTNSRCGCFRSMIHIRHVLERWIIWPCSYSSRSAVLAQQIILIFPCMGQKMPHQTNYFNLSISLKPPLPTKAEIYK